MSAEFANLFMFNKICFTFQILDIILIHSYELKGGRTIKGDF